MLQLINVFRQEGWKITFASAAAASPFMADLKALDVDSAGIELNSGSFDDFVKRLQPSVVLFDRFMTEEQFGWRVAECCPDALRVLDTEDLHCLRAARHKALKEKRAFSAEDLLQEDIAMREVAAILRCDLSLIISPVEMKLLEEVFRIDPVLLHYIPFLLDPLSGEKLSALPPFEEREHFISIGNFLHPPNRDAVLYLGESVWPLIRQQLPAAELHVYGAYPSKREEALHRPQQGFHMMGRAEDAMSVIAKARLLLAPLRFGAGIKGKLTDAMQCGTPSITTPVGAEGMHPGLEWNGVVAADAEAFAAAAVRLYLNRDSWLRAQKNGIAIVNSIYPKEPQGKQLIVRVAALRTNIAAHRRHNFTGAMLMHHTVSGTKYMSKWIEEKNRNR